jgi:hypothetical protein
MKRLPKSHKQLEHQQYGGVCIPFNLDRPFYSSKEYNILLEILFDFFLLHRFDPMFTASVNLLISEASNPTSETEQTYYNEFIQTYGTHYVSNVIVGGMVNLYTFMAENAYKSSSYEEVTHEISLTAQYEGVTFNTGIQTEEISQQISETFKRNSETLSVFQPPVSSKKNESILQ